MNCIGTTCDYALSIAERNFLNANKNHSEMARNSRETYTYRLRMEIKEMRRTVDHSTQALKTSRAANASFHSVFVY